MRISDWSSDVCSSDLEEFERPLPCDLRVLRAVVGALVAVEAVAGRVDVDLDLGMRLPHGVHVAHRNALVRFAEVQHHRTLQLLVLESGDLAAVVADAAGDTVEPCRREPGERSAPAVAD